MKRIGPALSVAGVAILLTAGTIVGATSGQAQVTTAAADAAHRVEQRNTSKTTASKPMLPAAETQAAIKAWTPEGLLRKLGERIVAKDLEGIIALHEPTAAVVEWDGSIARGHAGIRQMYIEWFASDPVLTVNPKQTLINGGQRQSDGTVRNRTASIMGDYTLEQNDENGNRVTYTGNFCDIVRQQPDGSWLYLQDNPYPPHH